MKGIDDRTDLAVQVIALSAKPGSLEPLFESRFRDNRNGACRVAFRHECLIQRDLAVPNRSPISLLFANSSAVHCHPQHREWRALSSNAPAIPIDQGFRLPALVSSGRMIRTVHDRPPALLRSLWYGG